jgi:hypothetical protein
MKKLFLASTIALLLASGAYAEEARPVSGVTPYGDFCWQCSTYGTKYRGSGRQVRHTEAVSAIKAYFNARGYAVGGVYGRGRFLRVDILRDGEIVDRIIFDRRSGRIRSIY